MERIGDLLGKATKLLAEACERPRFEAELLLAHAIDKDRNYLILHESDPIAREQADHFWQMVHRRAAHEPYAYIVGKASFYDIELVVEKGVLIPRPETELLVERAAALIARHDLQQIAEIGIGSGAIAIVLARKFPHLKIIATDISETALRVARRNIEAFGLQGRITLVYSNLLDAVEQQVEMVVSNPPYIEQGVTLMKDVAAYEPHEALFGGKEGDELLKAIVDLCIERKIGYLACEMGYNQRERIERYLQARGVCEIAFYRDYARLDRGFTVQITDSG